MKLTKNKCCSRNIDETPVFDYFLFKHSFDRLLFTKYFLTSCCFQGLKEKSLRPKMRGSGSGYFVICHKQTQQFNWGYVHAHVLI